MKIGWVGLGKLGLPCAAALAQQVTVIGHDTDDRVKAVIAGDVAPGRIEEGLPELLDSVRGNISTVDCIHEVVAATDKYVFVAVQTPHGEQFSGESEVPAYTQDFDYQYLIAAVADIAADAAELQKNVVIVVISTVLPGTIQKYIDPMMNEYTRVLYNPFFIAMGTTIDDFLAPEFVLIGHGHEPADHDAAVSLKMFYRAFHQEYGRSFGSARAQIMHWVEAELVKVSYNTFISMKIVFANTLGEIAQAVGANVDVVTDALANARQRIISPAYMTAGMGDGGACHPRDNIAMSWLARSLGLSANPFDFVTKAREAQSDALASLVTNMANSHGLPIVILGEAYKPGSDLTYGSPARLLRWQLEQRVKTHIAQYDPYVNSDQVFGETPYLVDPAVFVIAARHLDFKDYVFPNRSIVIDPFRYIPQSASRNGTVTIIRLGEGNA